MSAPRLILKQPTGWFAAGREFAQAIPLLSDGAFKLYVHACLRANRHTGRLDATVDELARAMTRVSRLSKFGQGRKWKFCSPAALRWL
jgi:hypothetical protein